MYKPIILPSLQHICYTMEGMFLFTRDGLYR